jgi:homoserine dehydrogenase
MSAPLLSARAAAAPFPAVRNRRLRPIRVALAGCGAVGGDFVRLLDQAGSEIAERYALRFELARVLVRGSARPRPAQVGAARLTTDLASFLATDADVVVEAIGGLEPAARIARAALASGRRFVTANKALIAAHGPELVRLARRHRTRIDFESAVAGGIPVLRAIRDQLLVTDITAVRGILNGTTNYILTRLAEGSTYRDALAEAQAKGFAEADPARDVGGEDAADKIRILAWLAFGAHPARLSVRTRGIVPHPDRLAADALALGGVPRLLAECARLEHGIEAVVEPAIVAADSELGQVRGEDNLVVVQSRWNGSLRLAGPGAGGAPTASALLGDLIRGARPLRPPREGRAAQGSADRPHRWVLSIPAAATAEPMLIRTLEQAELVPQQLRSDPDAIRVALAPSRWTQVELAVRALQANACAPVVSRLELPGGRG